MKDRVTLHGGPLDGVQTVVRDRQTFLRTGAVVDGVMKEVTYLRRRVAREDGKLGDRWVWSGSAGG